MLKSMFGIVSAAAVIGAVLIPTAASAAVGPPTTVTFAVTTGALTITAPATADLGSGPPGTNISGPLGTVTVTDARALLSAAWTASASSTDFTNVTHPTAAAIPVGDVDYAPGTITPTGTITATAAATTITLSGSAQTVVAGTAGVGNNTASWNPTITVHVPSDAVGGIYTATLAQSVV